MKKSRNYSQIENLNKLESKKIMVDETDNNVKKECNLLLSDIDKEVQKNDFKYDRLLVNFVLLEKENSRLNYKFDKKIKNLKLKYYSCFLLFLISLFFNWKKYYLFEILKKFFQGE